MKDAPRPMKQHVEPCGCIVTDYPGHVNTMMCADHQRAHLASRWKDNVDLVEANNLDLVGG